MYFCYTFYNKLYHFLVPRTVLREQFGETTEQDETPEPEEYMDNYDTVEDALKERGVFSPKLPFAGGRQNSSQSDVSLTQPPPKQKEEKFGPGIYCYALASLHGLFQFR